MKCPLCLFDDTKVSDSRVAGDGLSIRRRRECLRCSSRFSTTEELEILDLMVVKSNGKREVYDREKIVAGLRKALEKRNLEAGQFKSLVLSIETDIARLKEDVVTSSQIGDIVMNHLRRLDPVAYLRFASVYLAWEDPRAFVDEIDKLRRQTKKITPPHS